MLLLHGILLILARGCLGGDDSLVQDWPLHIHKVHHRRYSQGGQDGMIEYIFHHIGTTNKFFVEFGFDSDTYEGGAGSNTLNLQRHYQWKGLLMDGSHENSIINLKKERIFPDTIVPLFQKYEVPKVVDYLSVDIDSYDLWVLRAILEAGYRPRVVTAEFNCNYPFESTLVVSNDPAFRSEFPWGQRMYGASITAYDMMAKEFNYTVVAVLGIMDVLLVRNEELIGLATPPLSTFAHLAGVNAHKCCQPEERLKKMMWSYKTWAETKDMAAASAAGFAEIQKWKLVL